VHQHLHPSIVLLHHHVLRRVFEPPLLHRPEESRCISAPGVGEDDLAARCEQLGDQVCEGWGATPLVEHVGGDDEVEDSETFRVRRVPVEERGPWLAAHVDSGVVADEVEGGFVMIRREDSGAASEGDGGREPDAAAELEHASAGQVSLCQVPRQGDRARPELGPVREPLVAVEVFVVDQGVRRSGMQDAVGPVSDLDDGFGQPGPAAEVRPELVQGIIYRPTEAASRAARPSRSAAASWAIL
jgi:hypothetical protein